MKTMANLETVKPKVKPRMRWWIPIAIVALAVANVFRVRMSGDLDSMFKNMQTMLTIVVSVRTRVVHSRRGRPEADGAL